MISGVTTPDPPAGQHPWTGPTPPPAHPSATRPAAPVIPAAIAGLGVVLVVVGSFLPWVVSGQVRRSSYAISGVVDRLGIAGDGVLAVLVDLWPYFGPLCVLPVIVGALRWWRTAGVIAAVLGLASGTLAVAALAIAARGAGSGSVSLDPLGPSVMAAGAALLVGGGLALALRRTTRSRP